MQVIRVVMNHSSQNIWLSNNERLDIEGIKEKSPIDIWKVQMNSPINKPID